MVLYYTMAGVFFDKTVSLLVSKWRNMQNHFKETELINLIWPWEKQTSIVGQ